MYKKPKKISELGWWWILPDSPRTSPIRWQNLAQQSGSWDRYRFEPTTRYTRYKKSLTRSSSASQYLLMSLRQITKP